MSDINNRLKVSAMIFICLPLSGYLFGDFIFDSPAANNDSIRTQLETPSGKETLAQIDALGQFDVNNPKALTEALVSGRRECAHSIVSAELPTYLYHFYAITFQESLMRGDEIDKKLLRKRNNELLVRLKAEPKHTLSASNEYIEKTKGETAFEQLKCMVHQAIKILKI